MRKHLYKKKPCPRFVNNIELTNYFGIENGIAKCYCCRIAEIYQVSFNCGHVIAEINGGTHELKNMRPICQNCNSSMGTSNMDEFIEKYKLHIT